MWVRFRVRTGGRGSLVWISTPVAIDTHFYPRAFGPRIPGQEPSSMTSRHPSLPREGGADVPEAPAAPVKAQGPGDEGPALHYYPGKHQNAARQA